MANEQNLLKGKATQFKSGETAAKICGSKGGKATSAKKKMSEFAQMIAAAPVKDKAAKKALREAGIKNDDMINAALVVFGVYRAAIMGDMKAVEKWQQLTEGTAPTPDNTVKIVMTGPIQELSE